MLTKYISICLGALILITSCKTAQMSSGKSPMQSASPVTAVVLNTNQKITSVATSNSDIDMGMGQMKNTTTATNVYEVLSADNNNYRLSSKLSKFKMSIEMMGQENNFDSEKPEDRDSEMGKTLGGKLAAIDTALVNKNTGDVSTTGVKTDAAKKDDPENPLASMMSSMDGGGMNVNLESAFMVLPVGKKTGDSWTDSISKEKFKTVKTYTIRSINDGTATLDVTGTLSGSGQSDMQGSAVSFTMTSATKAVMIVDIKKGLVNSVSSSSDLNMTMDMMGQSMPMTGKTTTEIKYTY